MPDLSGNELKNWEHLNLNIKIFAFRFLNSYQGRKVERCPNELEFKIEPGVRNGFRKKLKGQGDNPPNMLPADIYLIVEQKPHDTYIRYGSVSFNLKL